MHFTGHALLITRGIDKLIWHMGASVNINPIPDDRADSFPRHPTSGPDGRRSTEKLGSIESRAQFHPESVQARWSSHQKDAEVQWNHLCVASPETFPL